MSSPAKGHTTKDTYNDSAFPDKTFCFFEVRQVARFVGVDEAEIKGRFILDFLEALSRWTNLDIDLVR